MRLFGLCVSQNSSEKQTQWDIWGEMDSKELAHCQLDETHPHYGG